jgi:hypothetical protein
MSHCVVLRLERLVRQRLPDEQPNHKYEHLGVWYSYARHYISPQALPERLSYALRGPVWIGG